MLSYVTVIIKNAVSLYYQGFWRFTNFDLLRLNVIKPVLHLLIHHQFPRFYKGKGFESYGGSMKDGKPQARVFRIQYTDRNQFRFSIEEGDGQKTQTGGYKMINQHSKVETFLSYEEGLRMAHELYDYIHQAEMVAMMNGKPLYTVMQQLNG